MKSYLKILLLIMVGSLFSACVGSTVSRKGIEAVERGEKAVVIAPCESRVKVNALGGLYDKIYDNLSCGAGWQRGETEEYFTQLRHQGVYVIDPGIYNLRSFLIDTGEYTYSSYKIRDTAQFYIYGGEVIYLGNIMFDLTKSALVAQMISINDKYEETKLMMIKYNPTLVHKLQKRLISLSDGVYIMQNIDGVVNYMLKSQR